MRKSRVEDFREFAAGCAGRLYRSAALLTGGDVHLAEDLVQETLGRMYMLWGRVHRIDNPAAYAQTVLVRTFLTHRRRRSTGERPLAEVPDVIPSPAGEDPALRMTLLDALDRLPPKDRAVVVLRYWEDRSVEQTAEILRTSPAAVRTRCVRALTRLRTLLGGSLVEFTAR
ncbi:SigE family RNA polymerase sigma factor [Streptomyces sp. NPDC005892]|uniref:SigE family RNA polymerase sigma factor n=1 Tax=Streptomyces sp. NPDC005892 TaxID=3155593 RepID=UPI0033C2BEB3